MDFFARPIAWYNLSPDLPTFFNLLLLRGRLCSTWLRRGKHATTSFEKFGGGRGPEHGYTHNFSCCCSASWWGVLRSVTWCRLTIAGEVFPKKLKYFLRFSALFIAYLTEAGNDACFFKYYLFTKLYAK